MSMSTIVAAALAVIIITVLATFMLGGFNDWDQATGCDQREGVSCVGEVDGGCPDGMTHVPALSCSSDSNICCR